MLFRKLALLLPAALSAMAAPASNNADFHSLADAGSPLLPDSRPPVSLDNDGPEGSGGDPTSIGPGDIPSCTGLREFYGLERWTYVQARWCLTQSGSTTIISQELAEPWYYWGGAWYTGKSHRLSYTTRGQVVKSSGSGSRDFDATGGQDGAGTQDLFDFKPKFAAGDYKISLDFHMEGPWWGADAAIDEHVEATGLRLK